MPSKRHTARGEIARTMQDLSSVLSNLVNPGSRPSPSFVSQIVRALRAGRLHRIFGRFAIIAAVVALWRGFADRFRRPPERGPSRFPSLPHQTATMALRREGIWTGLTLPSCCVRQIADFARHAPCRLPSDNGERFAFAEVTGGRTPRGTPAPLVEVDEVERCPVIAELARDAGLLETARRYLGFHPRLVQLRLYWSPLTRMERSQRQAGGQTVDFHFDIEASRSLYAFFYIEGGDRHSGAHVAIAGSHRRKPLRLALAPAFQPDHVVYASFGQDRELILEGEPGFGFLEDPACYHKALPPTRGHRLVLQLRLS